MRCECSNTLSIDNLICGKKNWNMQKWQCTVSMSFFITFIAQFCLFSTVRVFLYSFMFVKTKRQQKLLRAARVWSLFNRNRKYSTLLSWHTAKLVSAELFTHVLLPRQSLLPKHAVIIILSPDRFTQYNLYNYMPETSTPNMTSLQQAGWSSFLGVDVV